MSIEYSELASRLINETALVVFLKKDGKVRIMLCTKNMQTMQIACENTYIFERNSSIDSGNISVMDLIVGESRIFNHKRILDIQFAGIIDTKEKLDYVIEQYSLFKDTYEKTKPMEISMEHI